MAGGPERSRSRWTMLVMAAVVAGVVAAGAHGPVATAGPAAQAAAPSAAATEGVPAPAGEEAIVVVSPAAPDSPEAIGATRRELRSAASEAGVEVTRNVPEIGIASVDLPKSKSVGELRSELAGSDEVLSVEPNRQLELRFPSDPGTWRSDPDAPAGDTYQWHLRKSRFNRAWKRSRGGRSEVAVIDTGADARHPDLGPRIAAAFDHDDSLLHGPADRDENGHGTHVAGLACADSNNGFAIASSGFRCDLVVYKSDLTLASIAGSIVHAADRGVDVINMSFGGSGSSPAIERAVNYAYAREVILVAAAANDDVTDQGIPARYLQPPGSGPRMGAGKGLVVTAAQWDRKRAWFRPGRGNGISLAAFGAASPAHPGIFSTFPGNFTEIEASEFCLDCRSSLDGDDRFAHLEGTSMSAPQVAGAAALLRHRRPTLPARRVMKLIKKTAIRKRGYKKNLGWGIVNANKALRRTLRVTRKR